MIGNKYRPWISYGKTLIILLYLKSFHSAKGWKYFFNSFNNFRFDSGKLSLLGNNWIEGNTLIHCSDGVTSIGQRTFINTGCVIVCNLSITIGDDVLIADNVSIYDHDHNIHSNTSVYGKSGYITAEVKIGNNVWIGTHSTILKGVSIGDNSVIAAGSVVTTNVPSNQLWGGIPAKFIKDINSKDN